ncbi:uncharacterized protein LOC115632601 [Scaptodrosophila lebanonensis]|uniref:peptidylprolyl isomerase n=1 Tax=Drosophila lebanonensis TaxID=7225 RepID=A0A6J2UAZ4_DROLE|nr:uncharacterized protein LOC115632601 [Scaptodrosophila lebanonensis]
MAQSESDCSVSICNESKILQVDPPEVFDIYGIDDPTRKDEESVIRPFGSTTSIDTDQVDWSEHSEGEDQVCGFGMGYSSEDSEWNDRWLKKRAICLPEGWEERTKPITCETYYFNTHTQTEYLRFPIGRHGGPTACVTDDLVYPWTRFRCSHILVKHRDSQRPTSWREKIITRSRSEARALLENGRQKIVAGKMEFDELARVISDCCSARHGGDLGNFKLDQTHCEFEREVLRLPKGELSQIFETRAGFHIAVRMAASGEMSEGELKKKERIGKLSNINDRGRDKMHLKKKQHGVVSLQQQDKLKVKHYERKAEKKYIKDIQREDGNPSRLLRQHEASYRSLDLLQKIVDRVSGKKNKKKVQRAAEKKNLVREYNENFERNHLLKQLLCERNRECSEQSSNEPPTEVCSSTETDICSCADKSLYSSTTTLSPVTDTEFSSNIQRTLGGVSNTGNRIPPIDKVNSISSIEKARPDVVKKSKKNLGSNKKRSSDCSSTPTLPSPRYVLTNPKLFRKNTKRNFHPFMQKYPRCPLSRIYVPRSIHSIYSDTIIRPETSALDDSSHAELIK